MITGLGEKAERKKPEIIIAKTGLKYLDLE